MQLARVGVSRALLALLVAANVLLGPGCLVRRLKVIRPGIRTTEKLQTASLDQLVDKLRANDSQIRTLTATVDMEPSIGSVVKGEISEFKDVRGFVLIRKPDDVRIIGLYPVVRNRAFDMVSNGVDFKLYVPAKDKFIVGKNRLDQPSPRKLENLRPQHFLEALVVAPPAAGERPVLENDTDELHAAYVLHMLEEKNGRLFLRRNVWFDRVRLRVARQEIFDDNGDIVSDARYDNYDNFKGLQFPKVLTIMRPQDEYGVKLTVQKMELNAHLGSEKFALDQPPGSELIDLSKRGISQPSGNDGKPPVPPKRPGGGGD